MLTGVTAVRAQRSAGAGSTARPVRRALLSGASTLGLAGGGTRTRALVDAVLARDPWQWDTASLRSDFTQAVSQVYNVTPRGEPTR